MERLLHDLRYSLRSLRRSPGFTLAAVLTLALGIGANTAIFSVVNGVMLRPLPLPEAHRLVNLGWSWGGDPMPTVTATKFEFWREHGRVFDGVATWAGFTVAGPEGWPEEGVRGLDVSADFFRVAGVQPALGRSFTVEENRPGGPAVAVIGDALWRGHFDADPGVIGRSVPLDGEPHTVVGVMPPAFRFPYAPGFGEALRPLRRIADPRDGGHNSMALARLSAGVTRDQAQADVDRVLAAFRVAHPELAGSESERMMLLGFGDIFVGGLRHLLWILLGAIAFVLLIACANVANLLLARGAERQREVAVRVALGAGRGRIVRQLLTESLVIAGAAAVLGLLIATLGVPALLELSPTPLPREEEIGIDLRVLAFTLATALVTGVGFGLAAALPASSEDVGETLKEGGRGASGSRASGRIRGALVVGQAAIATVLLCGAGLLIATFANLRSVELGFEPRGVVAATFPRIPAELQSGEAMARFQEEAVREVAALPGVHAVATTSVVPFLGQLNLPMTVEGRPDATESSIQLRAISPDFFEVLGVPLRRGRGFSAADRRGGAPVIIINEATARHYFPGEDPIGRRIQLAAAGGEMVIPGLDEPPREIVGVVGDVRDMGLRQGSPPRILYTPQSQVPDMLVTMPGLLIRTSNPAETGRALAGVLRLMNPALPAPLTRPLTEIVGLSMEAERFAGTLLTLFAGLALALTAVGIYAVVAYGVRSRRREIGVRVALGARPARVIRLLARQGMAPVLTGLVLGTAGALGATRLLGGFVFGVEPHDPRTFAAVAALLVAVALLAILLPARRATRIDPASALRTD